MPCQVNCSAFGPRRFSFGSDKLRKYANKGGSRNGRGRGGHSIEPNPYLKVNYKLKVYRCLSMVKSNIMMAMVMSNKLILCFTLVASAKVSTFSLQSTYVCEKGVNFNLNNRFCAVSYDPYTELYIQKFPRNGITFRGTWMVVRIE